MDNVLRKTIIAATVTRSFPLLGLLQLCKMKGCLLSSSRAPVTHLLPRKRQTRYSNLGPFGPNISYSHVQLSNDLIGLEAPMCSRVEFSSSNSHFHTRPMRSPQRCHSAPNSHGSNCFVKFCVRFLASIISFTSSLLKGRLHAGSFGQFQQT